MDISEDCWDNVGLLHDISVTEPTTPHVSHQTTDFLCVQQHQHEVSFNTVVKIKLTVFFAKNSCLSLHKSFYSREKH